MSPSTHRRLPAWLIAASLVLALCLPAFAGAHGKPQRGHAPKVTGHAHRPRPRATAPGHGNPGHGHPGDNGRGKQVDVMTRNLYLGADLAPAIAATTPDELSAANGQILREVIANDFPTRAKGLAQEILTEKPDLVGLQEVALWRTDHASLTPVPAANRPRPRSATTTCSNCSTSSTKARPRTTSSSSRTSSTSRRPADDNGVPDDGPQPGIPERRDQRPADDARRDPRPARRRRADLERRRAGNFNTLLAVPILGQPLTDQTRLDGDRREGPRQPPVPLRQHPPGGVRPSGAGAEHPRPAGRRTGRAGRSGDEQPAGRPRRRPQLRRRHRRTRRPAGLRSPARGGHGRAQHRRPAQLLPQIEPARRWAPAAASPTSTTRSTT